MDAMMTNRYRYPSIRLYMCAYMRRRGKDDDLT